MIFKKIENKTLFSGKPKLKIKIQKKLNRKELYFLNEIYFRIFGLLIFSYIDAEIEDGECKINEEMKGMIEKSCNIVLKKNEKIYRSEKKPLLNYKSYTKTNFFLGDFYIALNFYKNRLVIDEEFPEKIFKKYIGSKHVGYGCIKNPDVYFEIGDKIYDQNYIVTRKDLNSKEYSKFLQYIKKIGMIQLKFTKNKNFLGLIDELYPKKKGTKVIKNLEEAKISALNYEKTNYQRKNFF